jgi:hypothetical protein
MVRGIVVSIKISLKTHAQRWADYILIKLGLNKKTRKLFCLLQSYVWFWQP